LSQTKAYLCSESERHDQAGDLVVLEDDGIILALNIQDLATQRQNGLKAQRQASSCF